MPASRLNHLLLERDLPACRNSTVRMKGSGPEFDNEVWYKLISTIKTANEVPMEDRYTGGKMDLKNADSHVKK